MQVSSLTLSLISHGHPDPHGNRYSPLGLPNPPPPAVSPELAEFLEEEPGLPLDMGGGGAGWAVSQGQPRLEQ